MIQGLGTNEGYMERNCDQKSCINLTFYFYLKNKTKIHKTQFTLQEVLKKQHLE